MVVSLCTGAFEPAAAQLTPHRGGVGYVANAPHQFVGASAHVFLLPMWGGIGLYADAKLDADSPEDHRNFDPTLTPREAELRGGEFIRDELTWRSYNLAVVRRFSPELTAYLGGGYARRLGYENYFEISGDDVVNTYWVEDPDREAGLVNVLGGMILRIGRRLGAQIGVESTPLGATIGVTYLLVRP